jgi:hypothetical protein
MLHVARIGVVAAALAASAMIVPGSSAQALRGHQSIVAGEASAVIEVAAKKKRKKARRKARSSCSMFEHGGVICRYRFRVCTCSDGNTYWIE